MPSQAIPRGTSASHRERRIIAAAGAAALVGGALVALAAPASAASPDVVIQEVYGGGGNSGATWTNDFIELYNRGSAAVDLSGWSVQYASSSGTSWQFTTLSGIIAPGAHYLVQEAKGAGGTTALPTADDTGSTAMSAGNGKVALVAGTTALSCGTSCAGASDVRDFVGYGGANDFEGGGPAPGLANTTSDSRSVTGADTDDNAADFTEGAPSPQNAAGETGGGGGGGPTPIEGLRIHDVQGPAHTSPYAGKRVGDVPGIVTAADARGFWMQDASPDADPATSEGIYVFTSSAPTVSVGDSVTVTGTVDEFRPGGASTNLSTTELTKPAVTVVAAGQPLPALTVIGPGGRDEPKTVIENDARGTVETTGVFDPAQDGIDFYESMEGMRVEIDDAQVVGPTNQYGETPVVPADATVRTNRGGIIFQQNDPNPERVILGTDLATAPTANVGDTYVGATVGILEYNFGNFMLEPTSAPNLHSGGLQREVTQPAADNQLSVATFNVENLDPTDGAAKFQRLAQTVVTNLAAPDIVALEEVQDNDGATDDGVVAADKTLGMLVGAITAAGGPAYAWREIDPTNDADGGEPGGNIRNVFLFRTDIGVHFVDRPGGDATTPTEVVTDKHGEPHLSLSPGRIAPNNSAWDDSRKPLAGEFTFHGRTFFVIANHFNSKGGDDPLVGRYQPPSFPSENQRHQQAALVRGFVDGLLAADPGANVVVVGDLNDFDFSTTADILVGDGSLTDLPRTLPLPERYTYDYEGNSEVLDHILLSTALTQAGYGYDVVHVNSEFADQVSDHDPQVVRLDVPTGKPVR